MKRRLAVGIGLVVFVAGATTQYFFHFIEFAGKSLVTAGHALQSIRPGGISLTLWIALALALILGSVRIRAKRRGREQSYAGLTGAYPGSRRYRVAAWEKSRAGAGVRPDDLEEPVEESGMETYRRQTLKSRASGGRARKRYTAAEGAKGGIESTPVTPGE
ncbi:MAG: hypothetical protein ACUVRC_04530 [Desulfotomaculales bacterium]